MKHSCGAPYHPQAQGKRQDSEASLRITRGMGRISNKVAYPSITQCTLAPIASWAHSVATLVQLTRLLRNSSKNLCLKCKRSPNSNYRLVLLTNAYEFDARVLRSNFNLSQVLSSTCDLPTSPMKLKMGSVARLGCAN
jgi:hypothetical protein